MNVLCSSRKEKINIFDKLLNNHLFCGILLEMKRSPCKGLPGQSSDNILRHTSGIIRNDCLNESSPLLFSGN